MAHSASPSKCDVTFFKKKLSPSTMLPLYITIVSLPIGRRPNSRHTLKVNICWTPNTQALHRSSVTPTYFESLISIVCSGQSAGSFTVRSRLCSSMAYDAVTSLTALATLTVMFSPDSSAATAGSFTRPSSVRMIAGEKCFDVYDATVVDSCRSRQSTSQLRMSEGTRSSAR